MHSRHLFHALTPTALARKRLLTTRQARLTHADMNRVSRAPGWPAVYCAWAAIAIATSLALAGLNAESVTRVLVLAFLALQLACRGFVVRAVAWMAPRTRFIVTGTLLAAIVEGVHMISTPVFLSLRVDRTTPVLRALENYGTDLAFTIPAYIVIFGVIWWCLTHYRFTTWRYVFVMALAQALGDGGLFFFAASPGMLLFLPYPMTNYHAVNVVPYLSVRGELPPSRRPHGSLVALVAVIATYLACGAAIRLVGTALGYA